MSRKPESVRTNRIEQGGVGLAFYRVPAWGIRRVRDCSLRNGKLRLVLFISGRVPGCVEIDRVRTVRAAGIARMVGRGVFISRVIR